MYIKQWQNFNIRHPILISTPLKIVYLTLSSIAQRSCIVLQELQHYLTDMIQSPNVAICADIHKPHRKDQKGLKLCK